MVYASSLAGVIPAIALMALAPQLVTSRSVRLRLHGRVVAADAAADALCALFASVSSGGSEQCDWRHFKAYAESDYV